MHATIFPGQGSQFLGMGKELYDASPAARHLFESANSLLGFCLTDAMFGDSEQTLTRTDVAQPAIFVHSMVLAATRPDLQPATRPDLQPATRPDLQPAMVAGHSLGEFSALVAAGVLSFEDGLRLVAIRAAAMQRACQLHPGTMAAVLGLPDEQVAELCATITDSGDTVVAANYNCPGQVVISGTLTGVARASELLKAAGARRVLPLAVGGAFHSPLMEPARAELARAIADTPFHAPACAVYQNATAQPARTVEAIRDNLVVQLTAPVRWTQSVTRMVADGATHFTECGPGRVLQGLVRKISPTAQTSDVADVVAV